MIDQEKFKQVRKGWGPQTELARKAGISQQLITDIETGKVRSTKAIYKIAAILNVSANYLDDEIPILDDELTDLMIQVKTLPPDQEPRVRNSIRELIEIARGKK